MNHCIRPPKSFLIFCAVLTTPIAAFGGSAASISFNSNEVFNVSKSLYAPLRQNAKAIPLEFMKNNSGQVSLALSSPSVRLGDPETLMDHSGAEKLPDNNQNLIARAGKLLTISGANGKHFDFTNWSKAISKQAEGDGETFKYAGAIKGTALHQVNVEYQHDAPGTFLVNAINNSVMYVHTGTELAVLSKDNQRLLVSA